MSLVCDVVEIWQVFRKTALRLTLLEYVLFPIPEPLGVYLAKVLDKKAVLRDALLAITKDAQSFRVDAEVRIDLSFDTVDGFKDHACKLLFHE